MNFRVRVSCVEAEAVPVFVAGDAGFDAFVRAHQTGLVRYATLLSGSAADAEDLVQDVLVRLYSRWDDVVCSEGSVLAYARRSVTNAYLSWRRRWSTRHIHLVDDEVLHRHPDDPWASAHDDELWQRLLRLSPQQRAAIVLRFYEDLDDGEIGRVLGCRPGTVRAHVSRGLAALRADGGRPHD